MCRYYRSVVKSAKVGIRFQRNNVIAWSNCRVYIFRTKVSFEFGVSVLVELHLRIHF